MRRRLIIAFIVVALLAALASQWAVNLMLPVFPSLHVLVDPPRWAYLLFYRRNRPGDGMPQVHFTLIIVFCLTAALLLLAVITGLAFAASRPVLLPVRRLARATQRMSGGDLSVRIQPRGRDELAQLVTSFNGMASALKNKVGELQQILHDHPGLTGDAATAARTAGPPPLRRRPRQPHRQRHPPRQPARDRNSRHPARQPRRQTAHHGNTRPRPRPAPPPRSPTYPTGPL